MSQPDPNDIEARLADLSQAALEDAKARRTPEQNAAALDELFERTRTTDDATSDTD